MHLVSMSWAPAVSPALPPIDGTGATATDSMLMLLCTLLGIVRRASTSERELSTLLSGTYAETLQGMHQVSASYNNTRSHYAHMVQATCRVAREYYSLLDNGTSTLGSRSCESNLRRLSGYECMASLKEAHEWVDPAPWDIARASITDVFSRHSSHQNSVTHNVGNGHAQVDVQSRSE